ncbi:tyrosine decarboxylase MfnA [Halobaculum sp. MBLA0147]|uniref:tyrosine decarboxylase MfnA n=1 Tax=Halobaculum sp. MBLA0147 TaxID=3079934 RepID=UPI00352412C1
MQTGVADHRPQSFDRVLSSMCTEPHPAARAAAERFLATNPGDPATYQTVARLEAAVVADLARLADHPVVGPNDPTVAGDAGVAVPTDDLGAGPSTDDASVAVSTDDGPTEPTYGYVTSGGTEANVQAIRAARNRADTRDPNVVVPSSGHFSFTKAAELLGVELREAPTHPVDSDPTKAGRVDVDAVRAAVDDDTVAVVGVAGSTAYGRVDPIPELGEIANEAGVHLHVDAAWGGFHLPFTDHAWSFADAPVDSLTIDPHKLGRAAVPAGGLLVREPATLDALAVDTPYLETHAQATLTGTRSGAGVASAAAALDALWPTGYRADYDRAVELATWLSEQLRDRGFAVRPRDMPIVAVALPEGLVDDLRAAGWRLSPTAAGEARVVLMPHVDRESLSAFLADLDRSR